MSHTELTARPSVLDRIGAALSGIRDWLDERGKAAWIAVMILGFIAVWPLGLAILGYMIWSKRMFSCRHRHDFRNFRSAGFAPTGSVDFLLEHFGLTGAGIAAAARELLGK